MTSHARVTSLGELVAAIPYALGFEVHDSLVVVGLREGFVDGYARMDLRDVVQGGAAQIIDPFRRRGVDTVFLIGIESSRGQSDVALTVTTEYAEGHLMPVAAGIVVRERHWWPVEDTSGVGVAVPEAAQVSACVAFIAEGAAPLASREHVRSLVVANPQLSALVAQELDLLRDIRPWRLRTRSAAGWAAVAAPCGPWPAPGPPSVLAAMGRSTLHRPWRDGLLTWLTPTSAPLKTIPAPVMRVLQQRLPARHLIPEPKDLVSRFATLCTVMPDEVPDVAAEVCAMTSVVAWWAGQGALAGEAGDRALELQPGHVLAGLVHQLVTMGAAPDQATPADVPRRTPRASA